MFVSPHFNLKLNKRLVSFVCVVKLCCSSSLKNAPPPHPSGTNLNHNPCSSPTSLKFLPLYQSLHARWILNKKSAPKSTASPCYHQEFTQALSPTRTFLCRIKQTLYAKNGCIRSQHLHTFAHMVSCSPCSRLSAN
jgi:hypothetical protein